MSNLIVPGDDLQTADGRRVIVLPDGAVHEVEPTPEMPPTMWETLQAEFADSGPTLEGMRREGKRVIRATYVEALALRKLGAR